MNTEITDKSHKTKIHGWILYDGECGLCCSLACKFNEFLTKHSFKLTPLQTPWVIERLSALKGELLIEMRFLTRDGNIYGGAEAVIEIARRIWWLWPLYFISQLPGVKRALNVAYKFIAERRNCALGACTLRRRPSIFWLILASLPITAPVLPLPPWALMWSLASGMFFQCKFLTLYVMPLSNLKTRGIRLFGYLFFWPGMDARTFLKADEKVCKPLRMDWWFAIAKTLFGVILLYTGVRKFINEQALLAGWVGLIGLVFLLHFGVFHLLALVWQYAGVKAVPIMNVPILAATVSEFWGVRWNRAFHLVAHQFLFRPLLRRFHVSTATATFFVFFVSGLVHELVISVPANGWFGAPTLYFIFQGFGVLLEHSRVGIRLGLGHGVQGRIFAIICTAGPVFLLFHPPFIFNVILPFLEAIKAY